MTECEWLKAVAGTWGIWIDHLMSLSLISDGFVDPTLNTRRLRKSRAANQNLKAWLNSMVLLSRPLLQTLVNKAFVKPHQRGAENFFRKLVGVNRELFTFRQG